MNVFKGGAILTFAFGSAVGIGWLLGYYVLPFSWR